MSSYDAVPLARLEPDYLARYGLQTAPFSSTHDDRFLYLDGERQQLLNMLHHLTRYSELVLLVVGARGIGKSSLKQRFVNQADDSYLICEVDAHPMMDANELLSIIAQGFGLIDMPSSPAELQNNLYRYLASLQQQDRVPVLLVDDAHELPQDALEALFFLNDAEAGEGNLLRSVLFCEPAIEVMLESSAIAPLKERVTHHMHIPPFDEEQTAEYIRHRLAVAGLEEASPFTPRDIRRVYKSSGGVPEYINEAAHQFLSGAKIEESRFDEDDEAEDEPMRWPWLNVRYMTLGGVALLLLGAVLWWQDEINRQFESAPAESPATEAASSAEPSIPSEPAPAEQIVEFGPQGITREEEQPVTEMPTEEPAMTTGDETEEPVPDSASGMAREETANSAADEAIPQTQTQSAQVPAEPIAETSSAEPAPESNAEPKPEPTLRLTGLVPDPVPASAKQQTLTLKGEGFNETTRVTVEWGNQRKTLPESRVTLNDAGELAFRITVGEEPETWVVRVHNPGTEADDSLRFTPVSNAATTQTDAPAASDTPTTQPEPAVAATSGLDWLQSQPADSFTLQLIASHQPDNLREFIERHQLSGPHAIFESRRNGEPWYAVAYGSYPDRSAAQRAAGNLPASIEPWIRRIGDIVASGSAAESSASKTVTEPVTEKPVPQNIALREHVAWLWDRDPAHYTLQLIAGQDEQAVKAFIRRHQLAGKAVFYQTRRERQPWYVVVAGDYASREAALAARQQLPAVLREQSPWPRPFSDIHADLYRN